MHAPNWIPAGIVIASAMVSAGTAATVAEGWSRARRAAVPSFELQLFPHGPWVKPATLGRNRVAADAAWIRAIQYYGEHRKSDRRYPYAETLFRTLTDLDPEFVNAYVLGALILAEDTGRFDQASALLLRGIEANPEAWRLSFELGFLHYWRARVGDATERALAVKWLTHASRLTGAPPSVSRLAAFAAGQSGERELAIALWEEALAAAENEAVREVARRYLADWQAGEPKETAPERGTGS